MGVAGLAKGWLGQKSANKQQQSVDAERVRAARQKYDFLTAAVNNAQAKRKSTLQFAKSAAKSSGFNIPDEAFDTLINTPDIQLPGFSAPLPGATPSALAAGLVSGIGGAAESWSLQDYMNKLAKQRALAGGTSAAVDISKGTSRSGNMSSGGTG
jgi:hypothetical protein